MEAIHSHRKLFQSMGIYPLPEQAPIWRKLLQNIARLMVLIGQFNSTAVCCAFLVVHFKADFIAGLAAIVQTISAFKVVGTFFVVSVQYRRIIQIFTDFNKAVNQSKLVI